MYYTYIMQSKKNNKFYIGWTNNIRNRLQEHNEGKSRATMAWAPWELVFYAAFQTEKQAKDFEKYLKSGSGRAFSYKRLVSEAARKKEWGEITPKL